MKKIFYAVIVIAVIAAIFVSFPPNRYILKAIIYLNADIDDYKIFSNRTVKSGIYQPWKLSDNFNKKQIPEKYKPILEDLKTVAFVVVKDSEIVHESYYRGYNEKSISNSFSVAKSIVSLLIGCALDDGLIKSLDEPVCNYIPEFKNPQNDKLTIKQVLTMSSGLNWDESYHSLFSVTTKSYYGSNIRELVSNLKVVEKPGEKFKYLSVNTILLALIIEKATGKKLSEYASEKLWTPLGASQDAIWSLDKENGEEKAYCCFNTGVCNFARIGQLILNKGNWNGIHLVSEKYIEEATSPAKWIKGENGNALDYYGYQFWMMSYRGHRVIYARGILGQYIFIIPYKNMVVVRLGEKRCSLKTGILPSDIYIWLNIAMDLI